MFGPENCKCSRKCHEKFSSPDVLRAFFDSFWNLADYLKQNSFLRGSIKKSLPARVRPADGSRKAKTVIFSYFVPDGKEGKRVCQDYFKSVLKLGWSRIYGCLDKEKAFRVLDGRGMSAAHNEIDDNDVVRHIESFPSYQSHYTRKDNQNKKYLNCDLNIRKKYDLYVKMCTEENKQSVKMKYYYNVFSICISNHLQKTLAKFVMNWI